MDRRGFIALATVVALAAPAIAQARTPARRAGSGPRPRRLALKFVHTGASFRGTFHDGAEYDRAAVEEFSRVVADHRTGEVHQVDPPLMDALWRLGQVMRRAELECVSGYRSVASNRLVGGVDDSTHLVAKAADLWFPADRLPEAVQRAVALRAGGVGAYAGFVHLDVGPIRFWDRRPEAPACGTACAGTGHAAPAAAPNVIAAPPAAPTLAEEVQQRLAARSSAAPRRTPIDILPDLGRGTLGGGGLSLPGLRW